MPGASPAGEVVLVELSDRHAVTKLCRDATVVIHFGGISSDLPLEMLLGPNVVGTANVFEAARAAGARVIYASSNHVAGFYARGTTITTEAPFRPDSMYGISKATGELIARYYFDRYGVESASLRIGSCLPRPERTRHLHTWLSPEDLERLVISCIEAPSLGCRTLWGVSANTRRWWRDDATQLGFSPSDNAENFANLVEADTTDPLAEKFQGGDFCSADVALKS
jgi:uronate dehydrogenase